MPNHVTNKLVLHGDEEQIKEMLESIRYDDGEIGSVDFNKIIPMPESLNIESGSGEYDSINAYLSAVNPDNKGFESFEKMDREQFNNICDKINAWRVFDKCKTDMTAMDVADTLERYSDIGNVASLIAMGKKYVDNAVNYGATSWYSWRIDNWGSKWSSYDEEEFEDNTLTFNTAWSRVMPIIQKLSEMYPDIFMEYRWADEDIGSNVGEADFSAGQMYKVNVTVDLRVYPRPTEQRSL